MSDIHSSPRRLSLSPRSILEPVSSGAVASSNNSETSDSERRRTSVPVLPPISSHKTSPRTTDSSTTSPAATNSVSDVNSGRSSLQLEVESVSVGPSSPIRKASYSSSNASTPRIGNMSFQLGTFPSNSSGSPRVTARANEVVTAAPISVAHSASQRLALESAVAFGRNISIGANRSSKLDRIDSPPIQLPISGTLSYQQAEASVTRDGSLIRFNDYFLAICGKTVGDMEGRNLFDFVFFESPEEMMQATCAIGSLTGSEEWSCSLKDNRKYDVVVSESEAPSLTTTPLPTVGKTMSRSRKSKGTLNVRLKLSSSSLFSHRDQYSVREYSNALCTIETNSNSFVILVVDDSITITTLVPHQLQSAGHTVHYENNGPDALDVLQQDPAFYDIVLLDINMPGMDGLQVCHAYRAFEQECIAGAVPASSSTSEESPGPSTRKVFIAFTGEISATIVHEVMSAGFDGFLPKPFSMKKFNEVISGLM